MLVLFLLIDSTTFPFVRNIFLNFVYTHSIFSHGKIFPLAFVEIIFCGIFHFIKPSILTLPTWNFFIRTLLSIITKRTHRQTCPTYKNICTLTYYTGAGGHRFETRLCIKALKIVPVATLLGAQYNKVCTGFSSLSLTTYTTNIAHYLQFLCIRLRWKCHSQCSSIPDIKHLPVMWSRPRHLAEQRQRQPITLFVLLTFMWRWPRIVFYWRLCDVDHVSPGR